MGYHKTKLRTNGKWKSEECGDIAIGLIEESSDERRTPYGVRSVFGWVCVWGDSL
jgi:hypothetical protein